MLALTPIATAAIHLTHRVLPLQSHRKLKGGLPLRWVELLRRSPDYYRLLWAKEPAEPRAELVQVHLEATNACNLRCTICTNPRQKAPLGMMDMETARAVVDQTLAAAGPGCGIGFYMRGESTLNPLLPEMIAYARSRGFRRLLLSSNVAKLSEERARAILGAGLSELRLSVDGARPDRYERVRLGGRFHRVCENIAMLDRVRRELGADVFFRLHATLDEEGLHDVPLFLRRFGDVVQRFKFTVAVNQGGLHTGGEAAQLSRLRFATSTRYKRPCRMFYSFTGVTWDGKISPCCVDYDEQFVAGRLQDGDSVGAAFAGERFRAFRSEQAQGRFGTLCESCGFSNALVDWFEDELNQYVEARAEELRDPRREGRYHRWLRAAIDRFDRLADG